MKYRLCTFVNNGNNWERIARNSKLLMFTSTITMSSAETLSTISSSESLTLQNVKGLSTNGFNTTWNSIDYGDYENMLNLTQAMKNGTDLLTPSIFVGFLAILGFFGNILVLFVYSVKYKPSVYRTIILTLAVYDALLCGITLPFEVYDIHNKFTFQADEWVCTFFRTLIYFFIFNSGNIVLLMTIDRFRRVCRPLKAQMTIGVTWGCIFLTFIFSIILSIPNMLIRGIHNVQIYGNITGRDCTISDKYINTKIPTIYFAFLLLLCLTNISILIMLYTLIAHDIIVHVRYRKSFKPERNNISECRNSTDVCLNAISLSVTQNEINNSVDLVEQNVREHPLKFKGMLTRTESEQKFITNAMSISRTRGTYNLNKVDAHGLKITKIATTISIFYILSYIPTLIENIMEGVYGEDVLYSHISSLLLDIIKRSFAINHVVNPIIYGFIDEKFRECCKDIFLICCKRCKR